MSIEDEMYSVTNEDLDDSNDNNEDDPNDNIEYSEEDDDQFRADLKVNMKFTINITN